MKKLPKIKESVSDEKIYNLAAWDGLHVRKNNDGTWDYWENGAWIELGKNNKIAAENLLEWMSPVNRENKN